MGAPADETTVLNRAKLSDYQLIDNAWVWNGEYLFRDAEKQSVVVLS
jgi:hypothetical protein